MNSVWLRYLPGFLLRHLESSDGAHEIIANTGWLFFDKIFRMSVGIFIGVWIARYLGPEQFGALNFAIAFVALFGAIATLGLDGIVVRDIIREPDRKFEILSSAFILKIIGGFCAFLIALGAIFVVRPLDSQAHWLVGIIAAGMVFQSFDAIELWFQSQVKSKYSVIAKNGAFMVLAFVRVFLIMNQASLTAFAYAALAEIIIGAGGLVAVFLRRQAIHPWCPQLHTAMKLLSESWPSLLSGLAIMVYMRIDQIMLAQMLGDKEVGLYSAALRFSEVWYFIPAAIVGSVMPALTQAKQVSEDLYIGRMQSLLNWLARIAYAIALPMSFFSIYLVTALYGQSFKSAGPILAVHIWSAIFVFIGVGITPYLLNEGLLKYSLIQTTIGVIANVCFNLFLIPLYGGLGAAIATLISQILASFLSNLTVPRLVPVFKMQLRALVKPY